MNRLTCITRAALVVLLFGCTPRSEGPALEEGQVSLDATNSAASIQSERPEIISVLASSVERLLTRASGVFLHDDHGENITLVTD